MVKNAITIKNLHISYKGLKKTSIRSTFFNRKKKNRFEVFQALKGVSINIEEGKILGIIGKNGSGKSTMLRAIAGIFSPDKGKVNLHGNTISLLSIGVGFNKKLSGYENIYLSGLLLGFTEEEIKEKEKEIIDFADIGDFIYKPVKTYSSGMYSKLAFAITAILETDIMLIDEVLSVGDVQFRKKSYNKMKELIFAEHRTVIIVSHSTNTLKELCDEVLWLHDGKIKMMGKPKEVLQQYEEFMQ
jgi:ABC-type polysaccharide/polyol phosphate transport system ATPase subunit